MKLAFVEIAGFRGFKDRTRFELPAGFAVLTGRNGVGKSTVLDAVDFVLTGTINKYTVREAKGGGLDEHIWWVGEGTPQDHYVTVGFADEDGVEPFVVTRSRQRGLSMAPESVGKRLCTVSPAQTWPEILVQTTLIRDETIAALSLDLPEQARFAAVRAAIGGLAGPDHTRRTGLVVEAAISAKTAQDERVASTQAALGRALGTLTEARSLADRQTDIAEAEQIIGTLASDLAAEPGDRAEKLRRRVADRKRSIPVLEAAIALAERLHGERIHSESDAGRVEFAAARSALDEAHQTRQKAGETLADAERLEVAVRERDVFATHMAALLDHGETVGLQGGHCPLCDAVRTSNEFAAAVAAARSKLSANGSQASMAAAALERARRAVVEAEIALTESESRLAQLEGRRASRLRDLERVAATFDQGGLTASPAEPEVARRLVLQKQEETASLERALFVLEASSAHDRVTALEGRVERLRAQLDHETAQLSVAERAVEAARQIDNGAKSVVNQVRMEQFDTVMPLLKELYHRLRPHTDWREIDTDFGGRIRASLNFTVDGRNPQFLFSSGQRRAAGLAFLLAIHLSRPWCHLRSLLLDDPVQHIDDYRALNLVEVLSAVRRTGRQVIIAVEDPALADVLCRRLRSTAVEAGRRFELSTDKNGSAEIERETDIFPLPREVLKTAEG